MYMLDGNGGWREVTGDPAVNILTTVSGWSTEVLERVPGPQVYAIIGELERIKAALTARLTAPRAANASGEGPEWIDAAEVARRYTLPDSYVYELARQGDLPSKKMGKYVRFAVADVKEWARKQNRSEG